jgi:hypothetical protein
VRRLSRVHIPGASGAGPLTSSVPCALSLFRPIVHPDICQVGPAGDRPVYAIYAGGNVTAHVPGRVNRLLARAGVGALQVVRILTSCTSPPRACGCGCNLEVLQGSRSGVGLVPVAVNDYSAQKCRCKPGACLVSAGVPPASVLQALQNSAKAGGAAWCRPVFGRCQGITRSEIVRLRASV